MTSVPKILVNKYTFFQAAADGGRRFAQALGFEGDPKDHKRLPGGPEPRSGYRSGGRDSHHVRKRMVRLPIPYSFLKLSPE